MKLLRFDRPAPNDAATALRALANEIERGDLGPVQLCAVAVLADGCSVFAFGPQATVYAAHTAFHAAAASLLMQVIDSDSGDRPAA